MPSGARVFFGWTAGLLGIAAALMFFLNVALPWADGTRDSEAAQRLTGWEKVSGHVTAVEPVYGSTRGGGFLEGSYLEAQRPATYTFPEIGRTARRMVDAETVKGDQSQAWYKQETGEMMVFSDLRLRYCETPDNSGCALLAGALPTVILIGGMLLSLLIGVLTGLFIACLAAAVHWIFIGRRAALA